MRTREFERLVAEGFALLPERFRTKVRNVAFLVEDEPSEEVRKEVGLENGETLLGFYRGIPHTARGADYGVGATLPDTIRIYQTPTEEEARLTSAGARGEAFKQAVRQVVADTVWHEVAHYFGMDEAEVQTRERKRMQSGAS